MSNISLPIGVFDSGMGGLTVLRALKATLPLESFIYLGDTARLPYGTKSPATVLQYAIQMARLLMKRQIKALVIACNTATTAALSDLQIMFPDMPMLGVVNPSAQAVVNATKNQRIAIFATETTIASHAYQHLILAKHPQAQILTRVCSLLVALAEEGMVNNAIATATITHYLSDFTHQDTLLLGCTHFPVFKPLLTSLLPAHVTIIDSAEVTACALRVLLQQKKLALTAGSNKQPKHCYLVTDFVERFQQIGEIFLGEPLLMNQIELVDAC